MNHKKIFIILPEKFSLGSKDKLVSINLYRDGKLFFVLISSNDSSHFFQVNQPSAVIVP